MKNLPGSGNYLEDNYDPDEGETVEDTYVCLCCGNRFVKEKDYCFILNKCFDCIEANPEV